MKSATINFGRLSIFAPLGAALALLLASCSGSQPGGSQPETAAASGGTDSGAVVEVVNGAPISQDLLDAFARNRRNLDLSKPALRDRVLKQIADFKLLEQAAKKAGYLKSPDFVAAAELGRLQGIAQATMRKFADPAQLDDSAVRAEYDKQYAGPGAREYTFDQMTFGTQEAAARFIAQVSGKNTFEQAMQVHRKDADVRVARTFPKVRGARLPPDIAAILATLKPGDTTKTAVQMQQSWVVLHLVDVGTAAAEPYDKVKDNLRNSLARRNAEERLAALRANAKITQTGVPVAAAPAKAPPIKMAPAARPAPATP